MTLAQVAALLQAPEGDGPTLLVASPESAARTQIDDLAFDVSAARPGSLFFCLREASGGGLEIARSAVEAGSVAAVVKEPFDGLGVPQMQVTDVRRSMGRVAAPFFGHPTRSLEVAGVTGTNGKTTTTFMLESIFRAGGVLTGLIGTIESRIAGEVRPAVRTTPEAIDLQRMFAEMVQSGVTHCAMEAASHGLAQGRLDGTHFRVGIFTNLSQDHLDFHASMEDYFQAKKALFTPDRVDHSLINIDDDWGRRLAEEIGSPFSTYSLESGADLVAVDVEPMQWGSRFRAQGLGLDCEITIRLPHRFNVANALAAAGAAHLMGFPEESIQRGLTELDGVPGRMERIDEGQDFTVLVDYAHTPDALNSMLPSARLLSKGRLLVVFGCGGDRERGKRPLMGAAVTKHSDLVIVTSDNPRSEAPEAIIDEIETALRDSPPPEGYRSIPDRREAIQQALAAARPGDVVVIAGKGHETYQEINGRRIEFDDRKVAADLLRAMIK